MALYMSEWAKGRAHLPVSAEARGAVAERFEFTVNEDLAIGDIIELAGLPAYHMPVDAVLVTDALGTSVTADIGIMSGDFGDDDVSRTSGAELYDGADVSAATVSRMSEATGFRVSTANSDRGIGLKIGGDDVTASGQKITLILFYVQ